MIIIATAYNDHLHVAAAEVVRHTGFTDHRLGAGLGPITGLRLRRFRSESSDLNLGFGGVLHLRSESPAVEPGEREMGNVDYLFVLDLDTKHMFLVTLSIHNL